MSKLVCRVTEQDAREMMGDGLAPARTYRCNEPATLVVIHTEPNYDDEDQPGWVQTYPICDRHAPEEIHGLKQCTSPEEFVIITIGTNGAIMVNEGGLRP